MVADLIFLGDRIALALGRGHMNQHRACVLMGFFEGGDQLLQVVAIDGPHVGKAQFLKYGPHLGHGQPFHAFFHPIQFGRERLANKGQVLELLFEVVGQELNRRAEAHLVEVAGNRPHVGRNRHFVVVQHH